MKLIEKTKEEQDEDFKNFSYYADQDCKLCHGTGKNGWHVELKQYIPCDCLMRNIKKELEKKNKIRESLIN